MFNDNSKAIYLQIADRICDEILAKKYASGNRLPSVREYAATVEVNANTVMRTYDLLAEREIIFNRRGIGFFVAENAVEKIKEMRRAQMFRSQMPKFFRSLAQLDISADELAELYRRFLLDENLE